MRTDDRWEVEFTPSPSKHSEFWGCSGKVELKYGARTIKSAKITFTWTPDDQLIDGGYWEPNASAAAYYKAMAISFNRNLWRPEVGHAVMAAARVLQDALQLQNGRKIVCVRQDNRGRISITVHPVCVFSFTSKLNLTQYRSSEMGIDLKLTPEDQEAFNSLIDRDRLKESVNHHLKERYTKQERGSGKTDKPTQADEKVKEELKKLDAWNNQQRINGR